MDKLVDVDISNIAEGALADSFKFALEKVVKDLYDPNKEPAKKRKIKVVVTFIPKASGDLVGIEIECDPVLAPEKKVDGHFFKHRDKKKGEFKAVVNITEPMDVPFDELDAALERNEPDFSNIRELKK